MIISLQTRNHKQKGGTWIGYRRTVLIAMMQMADVDWQRSQTVAWSVDRFSFNQQPLNSPCEGVVPTAVGWMIDWYLRLAKISRHCGLILIFGD